MSYSKGKISANLNAFLDMIAFSEIGAILLQNPASDDGYKVMVGSTPLHPVLFDSYATHPNVLNHTLNSTAAGRYQLLHRYYIAYATSLNLPDFSPESQDDIAIQQIKERGAIPDIMAGNFGAAVTTCSNLWASLPGNKDGQHINRLADLQAAYLSSGGMLC